MRGEFQAVTFKVRVALRLGYAQNPPRYAGYAGYAQLSMKQEMRA
jgi:hypothetical protein